MITSTPPLVVLDTNVLVAGLCRRIDSPSFKILQNIQQATLLALAYQSEVFYLWRPNLPDEEDNFVLEAAVATNALVVTKNITDFQRGELKFPDLAVLTPQQFCDLYL